MNKELEILWFCFLNKQRNNCPKLFKIIKKLYVTQIILIISFNGNSDHLNPFFKNLTILVPKQEKKVSKIFKKYSTSLKIPRKQINTR